MIFVFLVRSSSTEHPSGGDPDTGPLYIEKEGRSRGYGEAFSSSNLPMESLTVTTTSKQRREKSSSKSQQDEEEERGNSNTLPFISFFFFLCRNHQSFRW